MKQVTLDLHSTYFFSKDVATTFNDDIRNTNDFKFLKYKAKLLENTGADLKNGILRNRAIAVSLKYISNFWRSPEVPVINSKVDLKLKWMKHFLFCVTGDDNDNASFYYLKILTIKDTN